MAETERVQELYTVRQRDSSLVAVSIRYAYSFPACCRRSNYTSGIISTHTYIVSIDEDASVDSTDQLVNLRNQCEVRPHKARPPPWCYSWCAFSPPVLGAARLLTLMCGL